MDINFDSMTFHQINNQLTMELACMEMLDRKINDLNIDNPEFLDHWNELKISCITIISLFKKFNTG